MYNNIDFNKLFDNKSDYAKKYNCGKLDENTVNEVENGFGYKLPKSYIEFLKIQNGGYLSECFGESWLRAIYGIAKDEKSIYGIENLFNDEGVEWNYPNTLIPFGETQSGHDWYAMDYSDISKNEEPKIVRVENEDNFEKYFVSNNFKEFINMVYNGQDIDGKIIIDEKKIAQQKYQNLEKELDDINGNISLCRGFLFFGLIALVFAIFKHSLIVIIVTFFVLIGIVPFLIKYEKEYKEIKSKIKKYRNDEK